MSLYDDPYSQHHPLRRYSDNERRQLTDVLFQKWKDTYFSGISIEWLQFIRDTYVDINDRIEGRLGLSLWDCYVIGSILSKTHESLPDRPDCGYIETGTCHGGSAIFIAKLLEKCNKPQQAVVTMDLMDGVVDPGSNVAVTEDTLWSNVNACQVDPDRIKLVIGSSYSPESRNQVKDYKFHTFLMDGDHRYEGVKGDWESYSPLIVQDGYAIFHDYKMLPVSENHSQYDKLVPSWRDYGIKRFVDNLDTKEEWIRLGHIAPANMYMMRRL